MAANETLRPRYPTTTRRRATLPRRLLFVDVDPDPFAAAFAAWRAHGNASAAARASLDEPSAALAEIERVPGAFIRRIVAHWSAWPKHAA